MKAPPNQFVHIRAFPDYTFTDVLSPNADTLYSSAWLDLSGGPMILSVPEMGTPYFLMILMDAWTNVFASPGTRTTGNGKGDFAIVGPGWSGQLPPHVKRDQIPDEHGLAGRAHPDQWCERLMQPGNTAGFGTDYAWRAVMAMVGLGANIRVSERATAARQGFPSLTMYNGKRVCAKPARPLCHR